MSRLPDRLNYLYRQYINKSCTHEEMQELFQYVSDPAWKDRVETIVDEHLEQLQAPEGLPQIDWEFMYNKIMLHPDAEVITMNDAATRNPRFLWKKLAVAALIVLMLGAGAFWWLVRDRKTAVAVTVEKGIPADIQPGGNKAILTLADNSTIALDSAANGKLAQQGSSVVNKTKDGELTYAVSSSPPAGREGRGEAAYNMLSTPRGGQYQLVLPDGSKVWLNAASSIRYPTVFAANERSVDITGEAYFEVSKDPKKPFRVHFISTNREGAVEVLGTHFNINAYDDEPAIKTTLLEGSVKVTKDAASVILKPGEQTSVSQKSQLSHPIPVQTEEVVAWKNGSFQFDRVPLSAVMRQLSRWYDVEVVYEKEVPDINLGGEMKRDLSLSQVLKGLGKIGINYRIEGKKLVVLP